MSVVASPTIPVARRRRRGVSVVIPLCFLVIGALVVAGIFGTLVAPQNPATQHLTSVLAKPSGAHWLGTDALGRDVLSRLIVGARDALLGPFVMAVGAMVLGNLLGLLAGYRGGVVDAVLMRWVEVMWSIPSLLVLIVVAGVVHGGYWFAVLLLLLLAVPYDTRIIRNATIEQMPRPYVEAARTLGVSNWKIMTTDIWPNVAPFAVAQTALAFAGAVVGLSGLSFLGLGASVGTPDWGSMISDGQSVLFVNPVAALAPALLVVLTATSSNLVGDWLYDRMSSRGATR